MKTSMLKSALAAAALGLVSGSALSQGCPCAGGTLITAVAALTGQLAGRTVCGMAGTDRWQEFHSGASAAGGPLIDWKLGPGHPVDPSKQTGTWSVQGPDGSAAAVYNYGTGGTYAYAVCQEGVGRLHFCIPPARPAAVDIRRKTADPAAMTNPATRNITNVTVLAGQVSCAQSGPARPKVSNFR